MDPAQYPLQKQQAWFLVFCEHGNGNENEKLAERSERCKHRDGVQVSRRCSCHSAHLLQWLEQGIRARAPKRTPTKFSASVVLARPPAKVREQGRRQRRTQPGGLGSRLRLHRVEDGDEEEEIARAPKHTPAKPLASADLARPPAKVREQGRRQQRAQPGGLGSRLRFHRVEHDDEEELLARRNARQPGPLPPPTSLGPLPKFASKADVSEEPSRVVSGRACACIGLRMEMRRRRSLARQDARQPSPLPPPTSQAPLPQIASEIDVSKGPSRVVPGYACACIRQKMIEVKERERAARAPRRTPIKPSVAADLAGPLPQIASEADVVRELGRVVLGYASLVRDAREA